jgi:glycosyltransferase involved in cell wall biosynthesis
MHTTPDVSIILPVYNDEEYIETAIDSVLKQSFESLELLIVDDGSTDNTRTRLEKYNSKSQVVVIEHEENQGLPAALNTGLEHATGRYVMRQDADDRSLPGRIQTQYDYLTSNSDVAVVTSGVEVIDDDDNVLYTLSGPVDPGSQLQSQNSIVHGATMFRRKTVENLGGYDEFFRLCQDYDLWVRLHRAGYLIRTIRRPLYQLRREAELLSVVKRRKIALYGLIARLPTELKQQAKQQANISEITGAYDVLPSAKQGQYHRQLTLANIENRNRRVAIQNGFKSVQKLPLSPKSYMYLGLPMLPKVLIDWILSGVEGR